MMLHTHWCFIFLARARKCDSHALPLTHSLLLPFLYDPQDWKSLADEGRPITIGKEFF